MNHFLTQLPIIIATLSKALLRAIKEQILEVVRAVQKVIQSLWLVYHNIESSILGTIVDVCFSIIALRYFVALVAVGAIFYYFNLWWAFIIYIVVIIVAIVRFFSMPTEGTGGETDAHIQRKEKIVGFLRWPLRILFSLIMLYLTWYFSFFGKIDFINQYSIFQGNSSTNQPAPTVVIEPNNTQQPSGQVAVSIPTSPPTVVVEPSTQWQPSGQVAVSIPTSPPTVVVEPSTWQPSGQVAVSIPTSPPTVVVEPNSTQQQEIETLYVNIQQLILREGPGKEYSELNKISYGDAVVVTETSVSRDGGNWVKVKTGNFEGWLNKKYLSVTQPTSDNARNASFDCNQAKTATEIAICNDDDLCQMDKELVSLYRSHLRDYEHDPSIFNKLRGTQRSWLVERNRCGSYTPCLRIRYQERTAWLREFEAYN